MAKIRQLQSKYLLCRGWRECAAVFWTMTNRIKISSFCSILNMNFQKFGWHDDMWTWKALCEPSTLLFVRSNSSVLWNMFLSWIGRLGYLRRVFLQYLQRWHRSWKTWEYIFLQKVFENLEKSGDFFDKFATL